ncbi:MAG TPA: hypothetical protein VJ792_04220 [Candidatus Nitrosotalea sp.]|nr:hypothetical protein [Candidatus Nitrosotalea sp.]
MMSDISTKNPILLAARLFNLGAKHSDHKTYAEYEEILHEMRRLSEEQQVEFLLRVASLIDAYTYQNPPRR